MDNISRKAAIKVVQDNLAFSVKAHIIEALSALPAVEEWTVEGLAEAIKQALLKDGGDAFMRLDDDVATFTIDGDVNLLEVARQLISPTRPSD